MKKIIVPILVTLLCLSLGMNVYWSWRSHESPNAPSDAEQKTAEEKPDNKPDPLQHFIPAGWSITSNKVQALDRIYLPFLHRKFAGRQVRVAHVEGPGVTFTRADSTYVNKRVTRGTVVVEAETGRLLRVALHEEIPVGPLPGELPLNEAEKFYLSIGGGMRYVDLPKEPPQTSFQSILNRLYPGNLANDDLHTAARITGTYVIRAYDSSPLGTKPEALWFVHFHDISWPGGKVDPRYCCYQLNARGEYLRAGTFP